jgi:23S rRNA (cytidine1920-2'-O)/16S rRNA (cytidine1409-2'-O)-methyltransferase
MRADQLLVERGLAATRSQAQRLIASGVEWRITGDWRAVTKAGEALSLAAELRLLDDAERRYVSRAGLKLAGALAQCAVSVAGRVCLDVGQSTGGFTDCLLQQGAQWVTGVDVGHGQLHPALRDHPRVQCIEKFNARLLVDIKTIAKKSYMESVGVQNESDNFAARFESGYDLIVADLSFISLTLVLPAIAQCLAPAGEVLALVKPQFELQPDQIGKGGIVRDPQLYGLVRARLEQACEAAGLAALAWLDSSIAGGDGNRDFFVHARRDGVLRAAHPARLG